MWTKEIKIIIIIIIIVIIIMIVIVRITLQFNIQALLMLLYFNDLPFVNKKIPAGENCYRVKLCSKQRKTPCWDFAAFIFRGVTRTAEVGLRCSPQEIVLDHAFLVFRNVESPLLKDFVEFLEVSRRSCFRKLGGPGLIPYFFMKIYWHKHT